MRDGLTALLRDRPLTTLALGVAAGYALLDVGRGVDSFIEGLITHQPEHGVPFTANGVGGLSWPIGHRVLTFDKLVMGLIELAVIVGVALLIRRRGHATE